MSFRLTSLAFTCLCLLLAGNPKIAMGQNSSMSELTNIAAKIDAIRESHGMASAYLVLVIPEQAPWAFNRMIFSILKHSVHWFGTCSLCWGIHVCAAQMPLFSAIFLSICPCKSCIFSRGGQLNPANPLPVCLLRTSDKSRQWILPCDCIGDRPRELIFLGSYSLKMGNISG